MSTLLSDRIINLMSRLEPEQNIDAVFENLVENELVRRLNRYQLIDRTLCEKYQMSFEAFKAQNLVDQLDYTFEVESDFWDWEMAQDGIETVQVLLDELQEYRRECKIAHS